MVQPAIQHAIEKQIDDPLFPRRDVKGPPFAIEVVFESNRRTKMKALSAQLLMDSGQAIQPSRGEIVQRTAITGNIQRLPPQEQWFGVNADRSFIELGFAVNIPPSKKARWAIAEFLAHQWAAIYS
jgi:hypothetical protein